MSKPAQEKSFLLSTNEAFERMTEQQALETHAYSLGLQTVLWGMQIVKGAIVFSRMTAPLPKGMPVLPSDDQAHGVNIWGHARGLRTHELRTTETPNSETLYSCFVADLKDGPIVVVHPDHKGRYFRTSIWGIRGDTDTISQKNDGDHPAPVILIPYGWKGDLPKDLRKIYVRSRYMLLAPHIAVFGKDDLPHVHELQNQYKVISLKDWGKSDKILQKSSFPDVLRKDTKTPFNLLFYDVLCEAIQLISIQEDELGFIRQLSHIGIVQGKSFDYASLSQPVIDGLTKALLDGQSILEHKARTLSPLQTNGTWYLDYDVTSLDNWLFKGAVGWKHVWGDLASELLYPMTRIDENHEPLTGKYKYVLRFSAKNPIPSQFYSLTMYGLDGYFVPNDLQRYQVGNIPDTLEKDSDGGVTIYIQHDEPAKYKTNWLPAPNDGFFLVLRCYHPTDAFYNKKYTVPPVKRV
ncbi:DUF1214 domain-containing protein [Methanolapillus ohkumae]|uniref:DUF1254 domain-containing protein n=1 Tax=Methanolapillus ohkumae TaxID=3028298 RepID=A0AA96ZX45_9EURY|nr:hypothetical protein MsAm2_04190 [Methanosarcinaceae archaeon Am2]